MEPEKKLSTEISQKNLDIISFFDKNTDFVFAYKKTEKLASAVYMVTSLFSDNEPMKWTLRKKVSELLSFVITYKDTPKSAYLDFLYNIKTRILEIVSMLEISERGGLVSEMNFSILREEFSNVVEIFNTSNSLNRESFQSPIARTFFDVVRKDSQIKDGENFKSDHAEGGMIIQKIPQNDIKDKNFITDKAVFKRSNRQNTILNLLKKKKELNIKDMAQVIKDCSEKTIQRELNSFIEAGIIKRIGERRWSKYSLA